METAYAHTRSELPPDSWEPLINHLESTAARSSEFAAAFAPNAARLIGLWHDLGKYQPAFQRYLRGGTKGPEHAIVGAWHAWQRSRPDLALAIAAHHGALPKLADLEPKIERAAIMECPIPLDLLSVPPLENPPADAAALWIRFLFSSLVDADSLETERWDTGSPRWSCHASVFELANTLEAALARKSTCAIDSPINTLRQSVQSACRARSTDPMGAFRLTVPTGGGKTLSSMLFALRHAAHHGLKRVIVVIPYTSIIDQTARVFTEIFGTDAVLEHHSNLDPNKDSLANRRCVENWDSPIIVTTSVQFFETLHANRKRDLRKLHRIAESVVVLDEVQTFPLNLIKPIKDCLDRLVAHFRVSTVHCSATQPLLAQPQAQEIVPDVRALFGQATNRIHIKWPANPAEPLTWQDVAARICSHPARRVLAITHKKRDAMDLSLALEQKGVQCIHLSTLMCPAHRRARLAEINLALKTDQPCVVVSTQLVEAGVDLDFPVVYRALAGIDSLAQAAGRCNREGRLPEPGEFHVFVAPTNPPQGTLAAGLKRTRILLRTGPVDITDPGIHAKYFKDLYEMAGSPSQIPDREKRWDFPGVDELFKMIEDHGTPVVAPYGDDWFAAVSDAKEHPCVQNFRRLQPYTVSVPDAWLAVLKAKGCLEPLFPDCDESWYVLPGHELVYSPQFGFGGDGTSEMPLLVS